MDITPNVNLLKSLRGERTNYVAMIGEGVDNAFDAGAVNVSITIDDDIVSFSDDGRGITKDRIESVFSLGAHGAMTTTQLGRFGVGIKSQAVNAGDIMTVRSVSHDGEVVAEVNWREVLKVGSWNIADPYWLPVRAGTRTGTEITISNLRNPPKKVSLAKIKEDVAQRFFPALRDERVILINGEKVDVLPEPNMTDIVEAQLNLSGGRSAHLRAGVLVAPDRLNRVHLSFRHRVIMPQSSIGCGNYGGLTKMFARLQISGPWHLSKFKDGLADDGELEELQDAVYKILTPILIKCSSASISARIANLAAKLNDLVPEELKSRRPNQNNRYDRSAERKRNRTGSVGPEQSTDDGPSRSRGKPRDTLIITFDGVYEDHGIGEYQCTGRNHRVNLSKEDPFVAELISHRDEDFGKRCLLMAALAIFEEGRNMNNPSPELPLTTFGWRVSKQLSAQEVAREVA